MKELSVKSLADQLNDIRASLFDRLDENTPTLNHLSSLGIKYPTWRDHPLHTGHLWLESRRIDDGAEGLWRIHDDLYDLNEFVDQHPGGSDWLRLTKGVDITEAFETHHLTSTPNSMLSKYFVRKAKVPRNYPFTFEEKGFYKTLKKEIVEILSGIPKKPANVSKYITDFLFVSYVILAVLSIHFGSYTLGATAGVTLALAAIAAHNFFHQKDNFRMYYFDFTMMQSREWRISHAMSHHLYTNTIYDLEIALLEPFLQYLPTKKHFIFKYFSWIYAPIVWAASYFGFFVRVMTQKFYLGQKLTFDQLLPFTVPMLAFVVTGESLWICFTMFAWIVLVSGLYFGAVGLNAGHHHPLVFHDGDAKRAGDKVDWGVFQMDTVSDRKETSGSHFLAITSFGDHVLHHLFPTLDHGYLPYLYPVFLETCRKFGLEWKVTTQFEIIKGQYRQLAKDKGNKVPPGHQKFG